jgi:NAD(P)-dependent dehydrogenase (short-subunit alcohol dehydrogenase family)
MRIARPQPVSWHTDSSTSQYDAAMLWTPPRLDRTVSVVTGATRGVGRGIALALGDAGATVYVTGRSTVTEAAAEVSARGGRGIPVRTDHTDDRQVEALFARVREEAGRLDLLVANAWGGYADHDHRTFNAPFWEQPLSRWQTMFEAGLRVQLTTAWFAAPLLLEQRRGLVVLTGGWDDPAVYLGSLPYDLSKFATSRLVATLAHEFRPHGIAVVGAYPGFTRTEAVVAAFAAANLEPPPQAHSPEYVGRAVVHLAADPDVLALSGEGFQVATLAGRYRFVDVDGRSFERFLLPEENRLQPKQRMPSDG